jgi:hypothetical protein
LTKAQREAYYDEDMGTSAFDVEDEYVRLADQELLEDVGDFDSEDQEEVAAVENADEIAVIQLPFRSGPAIHCTNDELHLPESQEPQQE